MPITFAVDKAAHIVRTEAVGQITRLDIDQHLDAEFRAGGTTYPEIIDATCASVAFGPADVRAIVATIRRMASEGCFGPTAVIVGNEVGYGMMRMLGTLLEDVADVRPFRPGDRAAGESWVTAAACRPQVNKR